MLTVMCEDAFRRGNVPKTDRNLCRCTYVLGLVYSTFCSTAETELCIPMNCNYKHMAAQ